MQLLPGHGSGTLMWLQLSLEWRGLLLHNGQDALFRPIEGFQIQCMLLLKNYREIILTIDSTQSCVFSF